MTPLLQVIKEYLEARDSQVIIVEDGPGRLLWLHDGRKVIARITDRGLITQKGAATHCPEDPDFLQNLYNTINE